MSNPKDPFSLFGFDPFLSDFFGKYAKTETIVICKACSQKNRLKEGRKDPRCGACGLPL